MADLTKCNSQDCPIKEHCKRYTADSGIMQSWFTETPGRWEHHHSDLQRMIWQCDMFWGEQSEGIFQYLQNVVK